VQQFFSAGAVEASCQSLQTVRRALQKLSDDPFPNTKVSIRNFMLAAHIETQLYSR